MSLISLALQEATFKDRWQKALLGCATTLTCHSFVFHLINLPYHHPSIYPTLRQTIMNATLVLCVCYCLILCSVPSVAWIRPSGIVVHHPTRHLASRALASSQQPNEPPPPKKLGQKQGVYTRPSAAIERGSGFFIPGLEGARIRIAVGGVLLAATAINHVLSSTTTTSSSPSAGNVWAESLAILYSVLVLLQAGVETVQEAASRIQIIGSSTKNKTPTGTPTATLAEAWGVTADENPDWRDRVAWAARTLLSLTAATQVMLIGPPGVVYRLTQTGEGKAAAIPLTDSTALNALTETLRASPSGRVALPTTHPAAQTWAPGQVCVVVQRLHRDDATWAWMVTSPNSLASTMTQRDLQWLGPLARYVMPP